MLRLQLQDSRATRESIGRGTCIEKSLGSSMFPNAIDATGVCVSVSVWVCLGSCNKRQPTEGPKQASGKHRVS
jgi:hypothetical protein